METKWYIAGLHFECQKCGKCCSGPEEGVIWISKPEINMLAKHLGLSESELRKKYLKRIGLRVSIKENPCSKDCVFLTNVNGFKGCSIYDFRPMQCRNWPFWPVNLNSPNDWNEAATKCPGINKGRLYTFEKIQKINSALGARPRRGGKQKRWRDNNQTSLICGEVKQIYDWLNSKLKNVQCSACGKCCAFDSFGHKLFITTPELLYFKQNVKNLKSMSTQTCPYLENGKCNVRDYRFAGCRIFFCKADKDLQNKLSEEAIKKFKTICEKFDLPYHYVDLSTALNNP